MQRYDSKSITTQEVCTEIEALFANFPALFESFGAFLPSRNDGDLLEESEDDTAKRPKLTHLQAFPSVGSLQSFNKYILEDLSDSLGKNEAQFFHRLKSLLQANSPAGYDYFNEFARCVDLYSTCIITKTELMTLVEPLFGPSDLTVFIHPAYASIKKALHREDYAELRQYIEKQLKAFVETLRVVVSGRESSRRKSGWFFKPLMDMEQSGLQRHGHSYVMPARPRTVCSARLQAGITYLNSQWISVPYGSEDFSFKHMRKNPYEDALFKVEDERYDSDLAIEQIKFTLNILADEQEKLLKLPPEQQREYRLDRSIFTPIRLKPIFNVYGDHGQRFVELLGEEPIRALPVIIGRLKSKLEAWLANSKIEKERVWKDTAEKNFCKSLDHRSFYFKQNEKRFANSKSFLTEAKARYDRRLQAHQQFQVFLTSQHSDFDYEFLGGSKNKYFYSSFAGLSYGVPHCVGREFEDEVVVQGKVYSPQSDKPGFANGREVGRLPQFRLLFNCQAALDDALRLMLFALDKNPPQAKEKVKKWLKALYQDFLSSPIPSDIKLGNLDEVFGPLELEEAGVTVHAEEQKKILKRWTSGDEGDVASDSDDELSNSVGEPGVESMCLCRDVDFPAFLPLLNDSRVIYAPASIYVFFRFLYTVYERLMKVKHILALEYDRSDQEHHSTPLVKGKQYTYSDKVEAEYKNFLRTVCTVLRGTCDTAKYEDRCRQILARDSYVLFTFDKLLANTIKSMTVIAQDDQAKKAFSLYAKYRRMQKANEEMYLAEFCYVHKAAQTPHFRLHWNAATRVLSMTYVENPYEKLQPIPSASTLAYMHSFVRADTSSNSPLHRELRPFLRRLDRYYVNNVVGEAMFAKTLHVSQRIQVGFTDSNTRMRFIPGGEDSLYNSQFLKLGKVLSYVEQDDTLYSFSDKNSFVQKMTELGERAFAAWHQRWLSCSH